MDQKIERLTRFGNDEYGWVVIQLKKEQHIVPTHGRHEHSLTEKCWCEPTLDGYNEETRKCFYQHRGEQ